MSTSTVLNALVEGLEEVTSLREENKALREQVAQLQQSEEQIQVQLKEAVKERRTRTTAYMDCLRQLTEKNNLLLESEASWTTRMKTLNVSMEKEMAVRDDVWRKQLKEVEGQKQSSSNLICDLKSQIQALKKEVEERENSNSSSTTVAQKSSELEIVEAKWREKLHKLKLSMEKEIDKRDDVWRKQIKEMEQEKQNSSSMICQLQTQIQALKEVEERETPQEIEGAFNSSSTAHKLNVSMEQELSERDNVWRRKVKEMEKEKLKETDMWQRKQEIWNIAERRNNFLISELHKQMRALKQEKEEREQQREMERKENEWWRRENGLNGWIWA